MKRHARVLAFAFAVLPAAQSLAEAISIDVRKTDGCGCCLSWMEHLEENGFAPAGEDMAGGLLASFKRENGVPQHMVSCHTAVIEGYVIEGHVPASDIKQLLDERPDAVGLAVPGMPYGSPGMGPEEDREAYDVVLIGGDGLTEIFSSYPASN
ncbi:DUF411 domain-containing protein [Sedimentitalea sp. XS_ASV28]|uniref:DUF411 domain-containing protein n=1 Tax=Sedimentitalea sp. XS_ASV28 TaxID=3241296 RepID=UPI0035173A18